MDLVIKGKNLDVTESLREYAQQKVSRVGKYFDGIIDAQVELNVIKNKRVANNQIVQVTLHLRGGVIRAEEAKDNMYAAIDLVTDKLERQISRFKKTHGGKIERTRTSAGVLELEPVTVVSPEDFESESESPQIVRNKTFQIKPMQPEEAVLEMEMLGHDFFVFQHPDHGKVSIVYHRRDGHYGMIDAVTT
ncbi:MAG: ribosome-associated translation inhibitor RaiA [Candidatus Sericytochromatia bacterium]|nr:ribosome-associated translation inhibitor RaiA [Candidatus Sericytochromatia bacterium]